MTVGLYEAILACSSGLPVVGWFACNTELGLSEVLFMRMALWAIKLISDSKKLITMGHFVGL